MTEDIVQAAEKAAQKLYEERVAQATQEFFECLEKPTNELGIGDECETTFKEKLAAYHGTFLRAKKAAEGAEEDVLRV